MIADDANSQDNGGTQTSHDSAWSQMRAWSAVRVAAQTRAKSKAILPWFAPPAPRAWPTTPHLLVIGAGLAGSAVAQVMAQAGWQVTLVDQAEQPAQAASGNLAGLVHPLLTADWNIRSQFYWQGLQATWRWVADWVEQGQVIGDLSGLRQALLNDEDFQTSTQWLSQLDIPREWVRVEAASSANQPAGLVYRQAGWLSPPSLVQRALDHPSIRFQGGLEVEALVWHATSQQWHLHSGATNLNADAVVIATGALSRLNQAWQLPIRPLKGQVSYMNQQDCPYPLTGAMAHQGYTTPPVNGYWVTGATFEAPDLSQTTSLASHQRNAEKLAAVIPDWGPPAVNLWQGRVGFRPTTADHLPIIGALPDADWVEQAYLSQPHNKALFQYPAQRYHPALWVSQGHGARGLMSVWWAAERIRDQILGIAPATADAEMNRLDAAVHPGRFSLRPWRKGQQ